MVRSKPVASPFDTEEAQVASKVLEAACGARMPIRRRSASEEMLTRVEEGCCGEGSMEAIVFFGGSYYLTAVSTRCVRQWTSVDRYTFNLIEIVSRAKITR